MKSRGTADARTQKRNDIRLTAALIALAAVLGGMYAWGHRAPALQAEVTVDGALVETLDLSKNQEVTIQGAGGGTNRLVTEDGAVWCAEASCPDKVCVRQGRQSRDGGQIVCLPNRMVVKVSGK